MSNKKNLTILTILLVLIGFVSSSCNKNQIDYSQLSQEELLTISYDIPSIKDVYEDYFPIGAAIPEGRLKFTEENKTALKHFNSFTCENEMKPSYVQPSEGKFDFSKAQSLVDIAVENDIRMVGHVLVWYNQTPDWFFQDSNGKKLDPENKNHVNLVDKRLKDHITTVVRYYEDQNHVIERWDVVNEAILETEADGFRKCDWLTYLGPEYISKSFQYAHEADMIDGKKDIRLFYNDYQNYIPKKQEFIYELLEKMISKGVPIDGVGLQAHIGLQDPPVKDIENVIDRYAALGLEVEITELDINIYDKVMSSSILTPQINVSLGYRYKELFEMFKEKKDVLSGVTLWGFYDGATWLNMPEYAYYTPAHPLPFDPLLNPKWAYWAMVESSVLPDESEGIQLVEIKDRKADVYFTNEKPVLDGERDDCYKNATSIETLNPILEPFDGSECANGVFDILWDDSYMYIYATVTDPLLNKSSGRAHEQDSIEIFFDENNSKSGSFESTGDMQYRVNYDNYVTFNGLDRNYTFESAAKTTESGYVVEIRCKPQSITLQKGITIGFDVQVNDASSTATRHGLKTWAAVDNTGYMNTSVYGEIILKK